MSAIQPMLQFTQDLVQAHRETKRQKIEKFFTDHLGDLMESPAMHFRFGSSFRTRVSEINRDALCPIRIENVVVFVGKEERSSYWSVRR
jgi:hypothetical protein